MRDEFDPASKSGPHTNKCRLWHKRRHIRWGGDHIHVVFAFKSLSLLERVGKFKAHYPSLVSLACYRPILGESIQVVWRLFRFWEVLTARFDHSFLRHVISGEPRCMSYSEFTVLLNHRPCDYRFHFALLSCRQIMANVYFRNGRFTNASVPIRC